MLLGLGRGSGPRSIAGMRPWRAPWGRPLLRTRRADTEAACAAAGLRPWQDPHNRDPSFTRVRLRGEVIPLLDDVLGGGVVSALGRTADLLTDDLDALDDLAVAVAGAALAADGSLVVASLVDHPAAVRRRVLRTWAGRAAGTTPPDATALPDISPDRRQRLVGRRCPSGRRCPAGRRSACKRSFPGNRTRLPPADRRSPVPARRPADRRPVGAGGAFARRGGRRAPAWSSDARRSGDRRSSGPIR